jgi:HEAT repeat protein
MHTQTLNKHIKALHSPDAVERRTAAQELAEADERAVYALLNALGDENPGVQDAAMHSLTAIGGEVVAYMVLPLLREDSYLRNTAILLLKSLGSVAVPLLYPLIHDKDSDVRKFSVDLLAEIQEGVLPEKILPALDDPNPNVRASAVKAMGALRYEAGVEHIVRALRDEEWVCFTALETLGELGAESAVDAITALLQTELEAVRVQALETLGRLGSPRSREALMRHIRQSAGDEKTAAVRSLVQLGISSDMAELGDYLMEMFRESEWEGKLIALTGLRDLKEHRAFRLIVDEAGALDPSVPGDEERLIAVKEALRAFGCSGELAEALSDPELRFRGKMVAAEIAGDLGCEEAVPVLIELYRNHKRDVQRAAIKALGSMMQNGDARAAMVEALSDRDGHTRRLAARAIGDEGVESAFPLLLEHLKDEEYDDVMEEIVKALLKIDPGNLYARLDEFPPRVRESIGRYAADLDMLLKLSADGDVDVKVSAVGALGNVSGDESRKRIMEALRDDTPEVRRIAAMALETMGCRAEDIRPLLSDSDTWVRVRAVHALGEHGNHDAVALLTPLLEDNEVPVVLAAVEALARIGNEESLKAITLASKHPDGIVRQAVSSVLERA